MANDKYRYHRQDVYKDEEGIARFVPNRLVCYLLNKGGIDLNHLAEHVRVSDGEWEQFAQLIGYSISGFGDLSYATTDRWVNAYNDFQRNHSNKPGRKIEGWRE